MDESATGSANFWSDALRFEQPPSGAPAGAEPRLVYLGDEADGVALEVMAVKLEDGSLLVIHAMALRERYREQYEEAKEVAKVKRGETELRTESGAQVDAAAADALAAEAERGYDLSKAKRRRVGRPSLGARGTSPRVSFRATPELYRAAKRRAREEGRSVSELARDAVARYVDS